MAFIQNSNVSYYFPFASGTDGLREEVKGVEWLNGSNYTKPTTSGFLGSGVYSAYGGTNQCVVSGLRSPTYSGSTGTTSLTFAVWASGMGANAKFAAGWGGSSYWHAIQLWTDGSSRLGMSYWYVDPPSTPSPFAGGTSPICNNTGWTLLIARMEINASLQVSGSVSVNGGPWQNLGTRSFGASTWASANDANCLIGWADRVGSETDQRPIDEFIVWRNIPKFEDHELQNLHTLGATRHLPMTEYSTQFWSKVSGTKSAWVGGIDPSQNQFLGSGHVVAYLPFSGGFFEQVQGQNWIPDAEAKLTTSGFLGSGVYKDGGASVTCSATGAYPNGNSSDAVTVAVWTSGATPASLTARFGYNDHTVSLNLGTGNTQMSAHCGTAYGVNLAPVGEPIIASDWSLLVFRIEPGATSSYASGWVSVNGGSWSGLGTAFVNGYNLTGRYLGLYYSDLEQIHKNPIDEVVIWRGAPRFTDEQLGNLYELGRTYGRPMNEYLDQYAGWTKESGFTTAYASGLGFIGDDTVANLTGHLPFSGFVSGAITGSEFCRESGIAFVLNTCTSGTLSAFVRNSYVSGITSVYVRNEGGLASGYTTGYLHSQIVEAHVAAFARAILAHERHLFLKTISANVSTTSKAMVYGSEDGSFGFALAQSCGVIYNAATATMQSFRSSLFVKAPEPVAQQYTLSWPLFMVGGNVVKQGLGAYLRTCDTLSGAISTFVQGLGDPGSEGYIPESGRFKLFCKTVPGTRQLISAFLDGITTPSCPCDAWVMGIDGIMQSSGYAFVAGYNTSEESLAVYIESVLGLLAGQVDAQISGVCSPVTGVASAYAHGF